MYKDQRNQMLVEQLQKNIFEEKQNNLKTRKTLYERLKALKQEIQTTKRSLQVKKQEEGDLKSYNSSLRANLQDLKKKYRELSEHRDLQNVKYSRLVEVQKRKLQQNSGRLKQRSETVEVENRRIHSEITKSYDVESQLRETELEKAKAQIKEARGNQKRRDLSQEDYERAMAGAIESRMFQIEKVKREIQSREMEDRVQGKEAVLGHLEGSLEAVQKEGQMRIQILQVNVSFSSKVLTRRTKNWKKSWRIWWEGR